MTNGLGQKIKELRAQRDWTQNELWRHSGIGRTTLASIETGKVANPSAPTFLKLARAFNIRPEELYEAAGYIREPRIAYEETPEQLLDNLKLNIRRLERKLKENEEGD